MEEMVVETESHPVAGLPLDTHSHQTGNLPLSTQSHLPAILQLNAHCRLVTNPLHHTQSDLLHLLEPQNHAESNPLLAKQSHLAEFPLLDTQSHLASEGQITSQQAVSQPSLLQISAVMDSDRELVRCKTFSG